MSELKKTLGFILLFAVIMAAFYGLKSWIESGRYQVNAFRAEVTLESDGSMVVSEHWEVRYPQGYSVFFRDIGYRKYNPENPLYPDPLNRASFELLDANATGAQGKHISHVVRTSGERDERGDIIECPAGRSECESIFIWASSGFEREMHFYYRYRIKGAMTQYKDVAELNWVFLDQLESKVRNVELTINLPGIPENGIMAWGHGTEGNLDVLDGKVVATADVLKKGDVLELRLLLPKERFSVPEKNRIDRALKDDIINYEYQLAKETNMKIAIAEGLFYGTFGMLALLAVFAYIAYIKYDKEHIPKFTGKYYRELPADYSPAEMSFLYYFRKINDEDLTATVLDLIRRKYFLLDQNHETVSKKDPDFKLVLNPEMDLKGLKSHELVVVEWFIKTVGNGKEVTLKQIENYPKTSYNNALRFQNLTKKFVLQAKIEGSKHDFFEKGVANEKSKMFVVAIIPVIYALISFLLKSRYALDTTFALVASLVALVLYIFYISSIDKRSIKGNEDYAKWKAFRQFLLDFGNMKDYPIPGIVVWEHYLVYATSLKIADKVMEQLEVRLPKTLDDESLATSTFLGMGYYYPRYRLWYTFGRINSSMSLARQNVHQTIVRHRSQKVSGFGRGGGFGGGRSFGGGGGGFRSR